MKRIKNLLLLISLSLLTASCGVYNDGDVPFVVPTESQRTQKAFANNESTGTGFTFSADTSWSATVSEAGTAQQRSATKAAGTNDVTWLRLYNGDSEIYAGNAGTFNLTIGLDQNYTGMERSAKITITVGTQSFTVTVTQDGVKADGSDNHAPVPVTSVKLNKTELSLKTGTTETLTTTVSPDDATIKSVVWSSSDEKVATVNRITGKVTAVSAGAATITATSSSAPSVSGSCELTVTTGQGKDNPNIFDLNTRTTYKLSCDAQSFRIGGICSDPESLAFHFTDEDDWLFLADTPRAADDTETEAESVERWVYVKEHTGSAPRKTTFLVIGADIKHTIEVEQFPRNWDERPDPIEGPGWDNGEPKNLLKFMESDKRLSSATHTVTVSVYSELKAYELNVKDFPGWISGFSGPVKEVLCDRLNHDRPECANDIEVDVYTFTVLANTEGDRTWTLSFHGWENGIEHTCSINISQEAGGSTPDPVGKISIIGNTHYDVAAGGGSFDVYIDSEYDCMLYPEIENWPGWIRATKPAKRFIDDAEEIYGEYYVSTITVDGHTGQDAYTFAFSFRAATDEKNIESQTITVTRAGFIATEKPEMLFTFNNDIGCDTWEYVFTQEESSIDIDLQVHSNQAAFEVKVNQYPDGELIGKGEEWLHVAIEGEGEYRKVKLRVDVNPYSAWRNGTFRITATDGKTTQTAKVNVAQVPVNY